MRAGGQGPGDTTQHLADVSAREALRGSGLSVRSQGSRAKAAPAGGTEVGRAATWEKGHEPGGPEQVQRRGSVTGGAHTDQGVHVGAEAGPAASKFLLGRIYSQRADCG